MDECHFAEDLTSFKRVNGSRPAFTLDDDLY